MFSYCFPGCSASQWRQLESEAKALRLLYYRTHVLSIAKNHWKYFLGEFNVSATLSRPFLNSEAPEDAWWWDGCEASHRERFYLLLAKNHWNLQNPFSYPEYSVSKYSVIRGRHLHNHMGQGAEWMFGLAKVTLGDHPPLVTAERWNLGSPEVPLCQDLAGRFHSQEWISIQDCA